jgi:hypothetical protein
VERSRRVHGGLGLDPASTPILTDLVGPYYTLVLETTSPSLAAYEESGRRIMADAGWRKRYEKLLPFVESGYREIFNIVP